jgi:hypothetical protein
MALLLTMKEPLMHHHVGAEMKKCIEACERCHNICTQAAFRECLELGEKHVEPLHFRLMSDCSEICNLTANFMLRGSYFHAQSCQFCAAICEACAQSCQQIGNMTECVNACRHCAETCRQMVESTVVSAA